jgi:thymidylate synthase
MTDQTYLDLVREVLEHGVESEDRTGVGTKSVWVVTKRYDLSGGKIPILQCKYMNYRFPLGEMLWMLHGHSDATLLHNPEYGGSHIWDLEAKRFDRNGDLGYVYGVAWRRWNGKFDQLESFLDKMVKDPSGRRHLLLAWNPEKVDGETALPPCHVMVQANLRRTESAKYGVTKDEYGVTKDEYELRLAMTQRSADVLLGVPFNIAGYSLFAHLLAKILSVRMEKKVVAVELVHTTHDTHIYLNHLEAAKKLLETELPPSIPRLNITKEESRVEDYSLDDFIVSDYTPGPKITGRHN